MRVHPAGCRVACVCACLLLGAGCARAPEPRPLALPGVDPAVTARLAPGTPAFLAFLATASTDHLIELRAPLLEALHAPGPEGGAPRARIAAVLAGVDSTLAAARGLPTYRRESSYLAGLPDSLAAAVITRRREAAAVFGAAGRAPDEKSARLRELQEELLAAGDVHGVLPIWDDLAFLAHRRADLEASSALQRRRFARAQALGRIPDACHAYGQLAMASMNAGLGAGQRDTLRQLTAQARAAALADAASYALLLQGYDAFRFRRNAACRSLWQEGIDICREFGEPTAAVPTMVFLLRLYATLECWERVAPLLARAHGLLDEAVGGREPSVFQQLQQVRLATLDAGLLAADGRVEEADSVFRRTFAAAWALPYAEAGYVARQWFETMVAANRLDLAGDALGQIEPHARADDLPFLLPWVPFWRATVAWRAGDAETAGRELARFEADRTAQAWPVVKHLEYQHRALRARLVQARDPEAAARLLLAGWRALQDTLAASEPGPEAYLDLNRNPHLRWAAQDLLGGEPEVSYGLELLWRDAMLARSDRLEAIAGLAAAARALARAGRSRLDSLGAVHCVFGLRPDGVMRWTASGGGVEREVLPIAVDELHARVAALGRALATDPGDLDAPAPADLVRQLGELAGTLLPSRFLAAEGRPRRLFVSGEGFLARVPFGALDLGGPRGYEPLAASVELAWVRHGVAGGAPDAGPAAASDAAAGQGAGRAILVVADPVLDAATCRRFGLPERLAGARQEVADIRGALPGVAVIEGADATRAAVLGRWEQADALYFAGHVISDPLVPFHAWIPMSDGEGADEHPGIDIQDVLERRFPRRPAVFLSGCASGATYVDGLTWAPSLGDAFLDAGAAMTVQTLWAVRDRDAPVAADRILLACRGRRADLVAAVSAEVRRAMQGPRGVRHPFCWAAWVVELGGL